MARSITVTIGLAATALISAMVVSPALADPEPPIPPPASIDADTAKMLKDEAKSTAIAEKALGSGAVDVGSDSNGTITALYLQDAPASATAVAKNAGARVVTLALTKAQYDQFVAILAKRTWTSDASSYAYAYGGDFDTGRIALTTSAPSSVTAPLEKQFSGVLTIVRAPLSMGRRSRGSDATPHWGGATIYNTRDQGRCTSGMSVKTPNNTRYMVTAFHCGHVGDSFTSPGNGLSFGTMNNYRPFPQYDLAMLSGASYGTYIYVGNTTGTASHVISAANPGVGGNYCTSGYFSGSVCGRSVTSLNTTFCDVSGCTTHVVETTGTGRDGDSGAPFYATAGPDTMIRGIFFADDDVSRSYMEPWGTIAAQFGVSIVT